VAVYFKFLELDNPRILFMKSLIICNDSSLLNIINLKSFYFKGSLFLVPDRNLKDRLSQKGLKAFTGDLTKNYIYKKAKIKDFDIIFILLEDSILISDISKTIYKIEENIPVVALLNREFNPSIIKNYPKIQFVPLLSMFNGLFLDKIKEIVIKKRVERLKSVFNENDKVLIVIQHDPDPDAIASALALRTLLGRNKATAPIGSFGKVTRPENLAMLKLLEIEVEQIDDKVIKEYTKIAMVDVQPPYFGDQLLNVDVVIDHHPRQKNYKAIFREIKSNYGATSTILSEYLFASGIKIPQRLATALLYGIKSDTFFLDREVSHADIKAFSYLYPLANNNLLRRIERPELPVDALKSFGKALQKKTIVNGILFSHLGVVEREDVIPFLSDFCLQVEGIEWSVVSGISDKKIVICIRNSGFTKSAGEVVKEAFGELGSAGGHRSMAKAVIPIKVFEEKFGKSNDFDIRKHIRKYFVKAVKDKAQKFN